MSYTHRSRRPIIAAVSVLGMGAGAAPALAATSSHAAPGKPTLAQEIKKVDSTPLGAAIEREDMLTRLDSGAVSKLIANRKAIEKAIPVVSKVAAQPRGHQQEVKREWLKGERYLALSDQQLVAYHRSHATGARSVRALDTATTNLNYGNDLTGWAFNALATPGDPGPLPTRHLIR